ncbi:MAG: tRNA lysidine(34) synthetase TilS [Bacteroidota bacterium]
MSAATPSVERRIAAFIDTHGVLTPGQRVVVGLSGGVDSVVLTRTLAVLGYDVIAVHVHHGQRAQSAMDDAQFAEALADERGLAFSTTRLNLDPSATNLEAQMRAARYDALHAEARRRGAEVVAVGHHRDDQLETVLLNLLRGSGLRGLAGMRPSRTMEPGSEVRLVRPLLGIPRADLVAHARKQGWAWREDPTNVDTAFRRNALRHRVVPVLRETFGESVDATVARAADLVAAYLDAAPQPDLSVFDATRALPLGVLGGLPAVLRDDLISQALARWLPTAPRSQATIEAVSALTEAQVGQFVPLGAAERFGPAVVWREREALRFIGHDPRGTWVPVELAYPGARVETVEPARGTFSATLLDAAPAAETLRDEAPGTVTLDADAVPFPLTVRPWQPGDRMQPLGMNGHQAVSDLLTNAKVSSALRAGWPVVESGGRIVWVAGLRIAEHARVTSRTTRAVRLRWTSRDA